MNFKAVYLRLFLIVVPCIFFINIQGFAQNLNQYQQYLQHKERQHLMETLPPPSSNVQVNQDQAPALHGKACVHINSIIVVNTQNLSQLPVNHIIRPWQNKCMSLDDMNTVLNKLNKAYIDHGFVTTRAYLPQQDLKSGQLHIVVVDGKISDFQFEGVSAKNHETMAFPWVKGGILNLRDLEQGMDQMNRLPDWAATMKIAPGQKPGTSVVKINAHDPGILHGQLTVDNNGQSYSGRTIGRTMVTAEDLFGLLDMWTVEYDHSVREMDTIPFLPLKAQSLWDHGHSSEDGIATTISIVYISTGQDKDDTIRPKKISISVPRELSLVIPSVLQHYKLPMS